MNIEYLPLSALKPYERNARRHKEKDVGVIEKSIKDFGFNDPIGIWGEQNIIVEGHGRLLAAKKLGLKEVPVIRLDHMNDEQRRAYAVAHNRTAELSEWDDDALKAELGDIFNINMAELGFDSLNVTSASDWFDRENRNDTSRQEGNDEYNEFLDKFENPKTTDDCYTPDNIYNAVADWVREKYQLPEAEFIRPFYPGGDYQSARYPLGSVVVDNPPFSILAQIVDFYVENDVKFFLFAPALAVFNYCTRENVCAVCTQSKVTYENGANVATSFLTNLGDGSIVAYSAPDLFRAVDEQNDINEKAQTKSLPKYEYPDEVITSAKLGYLGKYGQVLEIRRDECRMIRALDAMKETKQGIFGNGLLLSERTAAERAAAERAAATKWQLSERERKISRALNPRE